MNFALNKPILLRFSPHMACPPIAMIQSNLKVQNWRESRMIQFCQKYPCPRREPAICNQTRLQREQSLLTCRVWPMPPVCRSPLRLRILRWFECWSGPTASARDAGYNGWLCRANTHMYASGSEWNNEKRDPLWL
jgi:hypothetical protein